MAKFPYKIWGNLGFDRHFKRFLNNLINDVGSDFKEQKSRVDELIRGVEQPSEIVDIRTDSDGVTHTVARDRLQSDQDKLLRKIVGTSVISYGATGDGETNDTKAFQDVLDLANEQGDVKVLIPDGTYILTEPLQIHSNTYIELSKNAILKRAGSQRLVFINGKIGDSNHAIGGYQGTGNIVIEGGIIDLMGDKAKAEDGETGGIILAHGRNITVRDTVIQNGYRSHMMEINSSQNVHVDNVTFRNLMGDGRSSGFEMIQIDHSYSAGFPWFGGWDNTFCDNVVISDCSFENGVRGVGQHVHIVGQYHTNIKILNSNFENFTDVAIKPEGFKNSLISGNTVKNTGSNGIMSSMCEDLTISNNIVEGAGARGIHVGGKDGKRSKKVIVINNLVKNCAIGLFVTAQDEGEVMNNKVSDSTRESIMINESNFIVSMNNAYYRASRQGNDVANSMLVRDSNNVTIKGDSHFTGTIKYRHAVLVERGCNNTIVYAVNADRGVRVTFRVNDNNALFNGEAFLTDEMFGQAGDVVNLNLDITEFSEVVIGSGYVNDGTFRSSSMYNFMSINFRVGTDKIVVPCADGLIEAEIISDKRIRITRADNGVRFIIGRKSGSHNLSYMVD